MIFIPPPIDELNIMSEDKTVLSSPSVDEELKTLEGWSRDGISILDTSCFHDHTSCSE